MPIPDKRLINSKPVLGSWKCKIMVQFFYFSGPSVGFTRSSLNKLRNLGVNV